MLRFIVFMVVCLLSNSANAARSAEVITDGAMVYEKADFDSTVVGYLQRGQKVRVSNRPKGAFYRVQFSQGVIGYISDVDVKVAGGKSSGQASEDDNKSRKRKKDRNKKKDPEPNETNKEDNPWDEDSAKSPSFSFGPIVSYLFSYSEKRDDNLAVDDMNFLTYGLNVGIPMFSGISLDISAHLTHYTSKFDKFYDQRGYGLASGSEKLLSFPAMFLDLVFTRVIFYVSPSFDVSAGVGINFPMQRLKITREVFDDEGDSTTSSSRRNSSDIPLTSVNLGGVAFLSLNYHIKNINLFIRPTYRHEQTIYFSLSCGLTFSL